MGTEVGENGAREKIGKRVHKVPGMFILCHIHGGSPPPAKPPASRFKWSNSVSDNVELRSNSSRL